MPRELLVAAVVLTAVSGCKGDKVLAGRRLMETNPAGALALFQEAEKTHSPCFECKVYEGLAHEKQGDLAAAAAAWEAAIAIPDAVGKTEVSWRLLDTYEKLFEASKNRAERLAIAKKAAPLEVSLAAARAWANEALAESYRAEMKAAQKAGKADAVKAAASAIQALYLPVQRKRELAIEATEALKALFIERAENAFKEKVGAELAEQGRFDPDTSEVALTNRFTIPSPSKDPAFDPKGDGFKVALRKAACVPLRAMLKELIEKVAGAVGVKVPDEKAIDSLFARIFPQAKAGFAAYGAEQKPPAGQVYLCMLRIPLRSLLGELFRFSE